ncbi:hypothetical protein Droror1_Dr00005298 [Drosera rotundifolia]
MGAFGELIVTHRSPTTLSIQKPILEELKPSKILIMPDLQHFSLDFSCQDLQPANRDYAQKKTSSINRIPSTKFAGFSTMEIFSRIQQSRMKTAQPQNKNPRPRSAATKKIPRVKISRTQTRLLRKETKPTFSRVKNSAAAKNKTGATTREWERTSTINQEITHRGGMEKI